MARTKTNTRNDTKTLTTSWRNRHLDKLYFCVFRIFLFSFLFIDNFLNENNKSGLNKKRFHLGIEPTPKYHKAILYWIGVKGQMTVPKLSIMINSNKTWSILIQWVMLINVRWHLSVCEKPYYTNKRNIQKREKGRFVEMCIRLVDFYFY